VGKESSSSGSRSDKTKFVLDMAKVSSFITGREAEVENEKIFVSSC
jgi:hypothetical protein